MADYLIKQDGKIHSRYTELKRCTPGSITKLIQERHGLLPRFENDTLRFGTLRHEMFEEETKRTGNLASAFGLDIPVEHPEKEFATEMFPGVIIHSRPDAVSVSHQFVADYKTMTYNPILPLHKHAIGRYRTDKQLLFYAYQLMIHGIRISHRAYLVEIWDKERTQIVGYDTFVDEIKITELKKVKDWTHGRCEVLVWGEQELAGELIPS